MKVNSRMTSSHEDIIEELNTTIRQNILTCLIPAATREMHLNALRCNIIFSCGPHYRASTSTQALESYHNVASL